jgi:glycosyltransferase involved in cell wall biosynthesis
MKILHVAYIYPPKLGVADGITTVVFNVTKELAKRGHEVTVYTSNLIDLHGNSFLTSGCSAINGVNVNYFKTTGRFKTFIATPAMLFLLSKNLSNYDVVHIHDCRSFQGIVAYLFAKLKNVPYVFQPHGSYFPSLSDSLSSTIAKVVLDKLVSGKIIRDASTIIALSEMEAEQYQHIEGLSKRIRIVPNGIALSEYSDLPPKGYFKKKFDIQDNKKILLYLGRIHKTKGIDFLIKAFAYLIKDMKCDNTVLVVAGPDDGYLAEAMSLAGSLGISDSILFTGFIDSKDKFAAYMDSNLFLTPSFYGFPVTFLEACAVGTPIITTTLGDKLSWIDGKIGYVTNPNHHDFAIAANMLISDFELAAKFSENCRKTVESFFSLENVVSKLEQVYKEVSKKNEI